MNKRERAIELRDLALSIVKARGEWMKTKPGWPNLLAFNNGDLRIAYRSPFQKMPPPPSGELIRTSMAHGLMPLENLPYGLDIWARGKVLNVEWSDGDVNVRSYKAGSWERELETLAGSLS
jgi:hypothetical protein